MFKQEKPSVKITIKTRKDCNESYFNYYVHEERTVKDRIHIVINRFSENDLDLFDYFDVTDAENYNFYKFIYEYFMCYFGDDLFSITVIKWGK